MGEMDPRDVQGDDREIVTAMQADEWRLQSLVGMGETDRCNLDGRQMWPRRQTGWEPARRLATALEKRAGELGLCDPHGGSVNNQKRDNAREKGQRGPKPLFVIFEK